MQEVTTLPILVATIGVIVGLVVGWLIRSKRSHREKAFINAGWQEQLEAQRTEHARLVEQNKGLMEQVSQFRESSSQAAGRATALAAELKEAWDKNDRLQHEVASARGQLEETNEAKLQLEQDLRSLSTNDSTLQTALAEKDDKIFKLSRELDSWHSRLPPLIEKYRQRNADADRLERELAEARETLQNLESQFDPDETRVDSIGTDALSDGLDASNDTMSTTGSRISATADPLRDDLKRIKGIGPAIEKTLNELGIFRLEQIAQLNEYEIDRVASRLRGFRSRIYREDWIGQARELTLPPEG